MALTQVRALINGEWMTLTYNQATGRYEREFTAPGTSIHQPSGYYNVEVNAANQGGADTSISGTQLPSLRFGTYETAVPTLTLVSPSPGYLTTQTPAFVVDAVDDDGGSGVDPGSFGASLPGTATYGTIDHGYRFAWTPAEPWGEGTHMVTFTVRDRDGNESTISAAYTVDTVPPMLYIRRPSLRHVVDDESVEIVAEASDASGVTVTIGGEPVQEAGGRFALTVPLQVGENHIPVTAVDGAGNETIQEIYMIRLVTDRAKADVDRLQRLYQQALEGGWESLSQEDREWFASAACLRGSYDAADLNRVGTAVRYLAGELRQRGYVAEAPDIVVDHVVPIFETDADGNIILDAEGEAVVKEIKRWSDTTWIEADAPVRSQMETYLANVETVRSAQGLYMPDIPTSMRKLGVEGANQIEAALVAVDAVLPNYTAWTAGEITCGGA